jgi:ATP-dependent helicase/nuclease subunit A
VARRKIIQELDKTFFVEAGAGSGKTKSLVDRMIALLKAGKCGIGEIAAVTFTRKAAAELRGRFQVELERAVADPGTTSPVRERLAAALQSLEQCYIGTIHSFCAKLLWERPIEIGLDPDFVEMEELENDVFRDDCWSEYLVRARLEETDMLRSLDEAGLTPEDLKGAFDAVSLYPEVAIAGGRPDIPNYETFRAALEKFLTRARQAVPKERPEKGYDGLQRLMLRCFNRQRNLGFENHRMLMETFEILDKDPKLTLNRWRSKEEARTFETEFIGIKQEVVAPALMAWREYRHKRIVRFLRPAISFFDERRKEENKLNYEDLLMHAARLLRDQPEVRRYFSRKFTHVLVDEFQDTDPIQAEVLMYLKGEDSEERDWQKLRPEPGSLFLVGDPKQSIYRFRRADIDIYNLVKQIVEEGGGEVLRLTTNFRSLDVLADWNNPLWKSVLPAEADKYQAAFAPLETVRTDERGCRSGVYKIVAPRVSWHKGEDIAIFDAAAIVDWIKWACDGNVKLARSEAEKSYVCPAQPSDFLILSRYKKHMDIYARALEERGIPFEITGSAVFTESEGIREITNLALALNDPENPIYTVAVLRGIFFGVSDEGLLEYKRDGGRFHFAMPGKDIIQSKKLGAVYVSLALAKLREWRRWTLELPVSAALQKIFEDSGILNFYASLEMGSSRVGNVLKLLEIVRNRERKGVTAFAQIVRFLKELSEVREIEEMSLTPARENAVRLMNLHKAKGLEAPVVFLANPVGIKEHAVERHVVRVGEERRRTGREVDGVRDGGLGPLGYFVFKEGKDGGKASNFHRNLLSQPVGWKEAAEEEGKYEAAEEIRLQYVAATRARNMLIISSYAGDMKNKAWNVIDGTLEGVTELERAVLGKQEEGRGVEAGARREKVILSRADVEQARKEVVENLKLAAEPSYAVERVTALAKKERELPARRHDFGLGLSWGRLVHQVLEAIGSGRLVLSMVSPSAHRGEVSRQGRLKKRPQAGIATPSSEAGDDDVSPRGTRAEFDAIKPAILDLEDRSKLELFIENMFAAEESDFSDREKLLAHVESILGSPFWARILKAEKRYFEIPFSIKTDKAGLEAVGALKAKGSNLPIILGGTIDLVFWEPAQDGKPGGWVIADYKTDLVRPQLLEEDVADLVAAYAPQIRLYAHFWKQITDESVLESGLYFTSIGRWVSVALK